MAAAVSSNASRRCSPLASVAVTVTLCHHGGVTICHHGTPGAGAREFAMTYAGTRDILDADSHVMELPDFLDEFVEPDVAERLRRRPLQAAAPLVAGAVRRAERRRSSADESATAEERLLVDKGWRTIGA